MIRSMSNAPANPAPRPSAPPPTAADVVATIDTVDHLVASSNDLWLKQCQAEMHTGDRLAQAGMATATLGGLTAAGGLVTGITGMLSAPFGIGLGVVGVIAAVGGLKLIDSGFRLALQGSVGTAGALLQREGLKVSTDELKQEVQQMQPSAPPPQQPVPAPFDPSQV